MPKLGTCIQQSTKTLRKTPGIESPQREARLIIATHLDMSLEDTFLCEDQSISSEKLKKITHGIQLRAQGYSLAHIRGEKEFHGHKFRLLPSVLMPRPETELILDHCIAYIRAQCADPTLFSAAHPLTILDLCTGTGCIAITLAHACADLQIPTHIVASDIDDAAIKNVHLNNTLHQGCIDTIIQGDLFSALSPSWRHSFSVITANPPYIPSALAAEASIPSESSRAIDGGIDGLYFYTKIISDMHEYLRSPGFIAFEIGHDQRDAVLSLLHDSGIQDTTWYPDLAGFPRLVCAKV